MCNTKKITRKIEVEFNYNGCDIDGYECNITNIKDTLQFQESNNISLFKLDIGDRLIDSEFNYCGEDTYRIDHQHRNILLDNDVCGCHSEGINDILIGKFSNTDINVCTEIESLHNAESLPEIEETNPPKLQISDIINNTVGIENNILRKLYYKIAVPILRFLGLWVENHDENNMNKGGDSLDGYTEFYPIHPNW